MANVEMKTLTIGDTTYKPVDTDAVHCCAQELTEEQKAQARANIGAASPADVSNAKTAAEKAASNAAVSAEAAETKAMEAQNNAQQAIDNAGAAKNYAEQAKQNAVVATPKRGTDYWTAADIAEIKGYVDEAILGGEW